MSLVCLICALILMSFQELHSSKLSEFLFPSLVMKEFKKQTSKTATGGRGESNNLLFLEALCSGCAM